MELPQKLYMPMAFQIQYTDMARAQLQKLEHHTCTSVQERLRVIASVDPYAHGSIDPSAQHNDRRIIDIEGLAVTLWISNEIKVITITNISGSTWNASTVSVAGSHAVPGAQT